MFILLSSAATPRYKQDVLRCLSAPLGARVQFRYAKKYVGDNVLQRLAARTVAGNEEAIICFVDTTVAGVSPLLPVRRAIVEAVVLHGSTLSVTLRMEGMAYCEPSGFTARISSASGNTTPTDAGNVRSGKYFLFVPGSIDALEDTGLEVDASLTQWERIVEQLQRNPTFSEEPFFWTLLGIAYPNQDVSREETFTRWEEAMAGNARRHLLIYHYRPQGGDIQQMKLDVQVGGALVAGSPAAIDVDSRYDLKRWYLNTQPPNLHAQYGWIRIRTNDSWDLDLPVIVNSSRRSLIIAALLAGAFIAGPSVTTALTQHAASLRLDFRGELDWPLILQVFVSLISGWVAAFLVLFFSSVPRVRT